MCTKCLHDAKTPGRLERSVPTAYGFVWGDRMIFKGYSRIFSTENGRQFETIGAFWDEVAAVFGREQIRGLGCNWTRSTIEYVIGLKSNGDMNAGAPISGTWREIPLPDTGWQRYQGTADTLDVLYGEIYKGGSLTYEIETFNEDGTCLIAVTRD